MVRDITRAFVIARVEMYAGPFERSFERARVGAGVAYVARRASRTSRAYVRRVARRVRTPPLTRVRPRVGAFVRTRSRSRVREGSEGARVRVRARVRRGAYVRTLVRKARARTSSRVTRRGYRRGTRTRFVGAYVSAPYWGARATYARARVFVRAFVRKARAYSLAFRSRVFARVFARVSKGVSKFEHSPLARRIERSFESFARSRVRAYRTLVRKAGVESSCLRIEHAFETRFETRVRVFACALSKRCSNHRTRIRTGIRIARAALSRRVFERGESNTRSIHRTRFGPVTPGAGAREQRANQISDFLEKIGPQYPSLCTTYTDCGKFAT